ncbi:MAG: DUF4097 family beta strand repeat-containing protein [Thermoanaerobaculales bacterium]|nr:DUF4097 family beta strand repeat-containing protein [Thermoanaerobaculales bacterium]
MKKTALVTLMVLGLAGLAHADIVVDETRPLTADGVVEISNISGDVAVVGWSGDSVVITGTLEQGVKNLEISAGGQRLRIEVEQHRRSRTSSDADLMIKMPSTANLEVETVSADISVDGIGGDVELESVSGRVEVSSCARSLEASSVSGDVLAVSAAGRSELDSVSGDVIVRNASGRIDAESVSGRIEIEGGALDLLDGETVSGSIACSARPTDNGRFTFETMSGTIDLRVSPDWSASYYVETYSGAIRNDIGPEPRRTDDYGPGKELRFTTGSGGARISIESFSGSVRLRAD